ncbi:MAG: transporter [Myxococcota bacterium]
MITLGSAIDFTLIPMATLVASGAVALIRPAGPRLRSGVLHLAAGVVFAVVAMELLPSIIHSDALVVVTVGFTLGASLMLLLRHLVGGHDDPAGATESGSDPRLPVGMLVAIGIDLTVDGLMLGVGFAAGARAGVVLTIALSLEVVALGLATAASLKEGGHAVGRVIGVLVGLSALFAVGAAVGGLALGYAPPELVPGVLAFACAALLFLVTEELLEEAHEVKESPALTMMFFVGFLALMLLEMVGAAPH